ncbi:MAG: DUF4129 domain-containing protein, partial [Caldilineae bacterium]
PPPPPPPAAENPPLLPPWAGGAAFWAGLLTVVIYFLVLFLVRRRAARKWGLAWWSRLVAWWRVFWGRAEAGVSALRERLGRGLNLEVGGITPELPWRFVRLAGMSATERTRYFYLSILRRAREVGYPRRESQTPREYEASIVASWPEIGEDMHTLTESFMQARYAPPPLPDEEARRARGAWEALKRALRRRRRQQLQDT